MIWQDNQAAIQIAMNRGALAKKTRAMDMRVMTIRNKIEDMKVVPMYLRTSEMIADIGTKALDPKLSSSICGIDSADIGRGKDKCNSLGGQRPCGSLPLAAQRTLQRPKPWSRSPQSCAGSPEGLSRLRPTDYHPQEDLQM